MVEIPKACRMVLILVFSTPAYSPERTKVESPTKACVELYSYNPASVSNGRIIT
ncbi:MAG TPA: hypothetical protein VK255_03390 [Patescibacteria group bacterium]|nr:hypothetical protein [Patescibacteria group bacterium]